MTNRISIECSELDDFELEDMKRHLIADGGIEDVVLAPVEWKPIPPGGKIDIQASAAPFFIVVKLAHDHWKILAAGLGGKLADDAHDYVRGRLKEWSKNRADRYETRILHGPNGDVVKVFKVRKKL